MVIDAFPSMRAQDVQWWIRVQVAGRHDLDVLQLQLRVDVVDGQQGEGAQVARPWSLLPALTRVSVRPLVLAELGEGADVGGPGGESHAHGLASRHEVRAPPVRVLLHSALHRENINIEIYIQAKCNKLLAK